jgi:hypothetical protein
VPKRMFSGFGAMGFRCCTLSGLVPDGTVVENVSKHRHGCGGEGARGREGLDCFSVFVQGSSV